MMITCDKLLCPQGWLENQSVTVKNGFIVAIETINPHLASAHHHPIIAPGFIDIQVNGGGGVLFNQQPNSGALQHMFSAHQAFGTTAMLPTLITDGVETMQQAADAVIQARTLGTPGIIGVHFEGPWLSKARKGVHPEEHIRQPSEQELQVLRQSNLGRVMVTLAPEQVDPAIIKEMVDDGIIVFLGHSAADAKQVSRALQAGASGFTHLFNAMSPMQSRAPGMVGAALQSPTSYAGLIVDGFHVDPMCCQVALRCLGRDRVALVTDAMALAASEESEMAFFDTTIHKKNNCLTTPDGTLAGSCLTMIDAVRNTMQQCQVSLQDALFMASTTPAYAAGVGDKQGSIEVGMAADFVALDNNVHIRQVYQAGTATQPILQE